jgi:hypothetical protein
MRASCSRDVAYRNDRGRLAVGVVPLILPALRFHIVTVECSSAIAVFAICYLCWRHVCILVRSERSVFVTVQTNMALCSLLYLQRTRLGNRPLTLKSRQSLLVYLSVKTSVTQIHWRRSPLSAMCSHSHGKNVTIIFVPPVLWNSSTPSGLSDNWCMGFFIVQFCLKSVENNILYSKTY